MNISLSDIPVLSADDSFRNPCIASGCEALCCRDMNLKMTSKEWRNYSREVRRSFPDIVILETSYESIFGQLNIRDSVVKKKGLYYCKQDGFVYVLVKGDCPFLNENNCLVYENQLIQPSACRHFQKDSCECCNIRNGVENNSYLPLHIDNLEC